LVPDAESAGAAAERLGPDPEAAGRQYQSLRVRLLDYFDWKAQRPGGGGGRDARPRGAPAGEGDAIERIDAYAYGVARLVLLEHHRSQLREHRASAGAAVELAGRPEGDEEARIACLVRCLQNLSPEERSLIIGYYEGAGRSHLQGRKALAARLGIGYATLKTRAHRLRIRLEACLRDCLAGGSPHR
jgi:hypothetical protein